MVLETAATVGEMATTAIRNPSRVPPYIKKRVSEPLRRWHLKAELQGLPRQKQWLDSLRTRDDYLLVVLDACRYDELNRVFTDYFTGNVRPVASAGHDTFEYMRRCWPDEYPDVTYVSGATPVANSRHAPFEDPQLKEWYEGYVPPDHIGEIVDAWDYRWDRSLGTVPPEAVVEETLARTNETRLVTHLFQPHAPYIGDPELLGHTDSQDAEPDTGEPMDKPVWEAVWSGDVSDQDLRECYRGNLTRALESVCWLVRETDRHVVVMGDHGEALGEWGVYSHPRTPHPHIRKVPWGSVTGLTDDGEAAARRAARRDTSAADGGMDGDVKQRLEAFGYIE